LYDSRGTLIGINLGAWYTNSLKYDYKNGTRIILLPSEDTKKKISQNHADVSGDKNPFSGKKHTAVARLRIKLAQLEMEYAKSHFMSGKFHIPEQEWMKNVVWLGAGTVK
jgi:hypothetical protein